MRDVSSMEGYFTHKSGLLPHCIAFQFHISGNIIWTQGQGNSKHIQKDKIALRLEQTNIRSKPLSCLGSYRAGDLASIDCGHGLSIATTNDFERAERSCSYRDVFKGCVTGSECLTGHIYDRWTQRKIKIVAIKSRR